MGESGSAGRAVVTEGQQPIRVLHVVGRVMGGGVLAFVMNHYRHMDRSTVQFDFLVGEDSLVVPAEEIEALGGRVFKVPRYQDVGGFMRGVRAVIRRTRPAIVHSHLNSLSVIPLAVARAERVPVRIAHSHSTAGPGEGAKNIAKSLLQPLSRLEPTAYAACSDHAARWLFGERAANNDRVHLIHNAIELARFAYNQDVRHQVRTELGIPDSAYVVGQVGRLCQQKNQLFLLPVVQELLRRNRQTIVLMAGEGNLRPRIEQEITRRDLGKEVRLLGLRSDIPDLYQAMDVLALPSTYEGLGMVAIEAQASGLRVVASDAVPNEAKVTDLVDFLPLTAPSETWVNALAPQVSRLPRRSHIDEVAAAGYEIEDSALDLGNWYLQLIQQSGSEHGFHFRPVQEVL